MKQEINPQIRNEDVHDLFTYLPTEIMLNIFLRIPTRTVMSCKCVCKAWRDLLKSHEFVQSYLSKSVPGLAVYLRRIKRYRIVEFVDEHCLDIVFSIDLPFEGGEFIVQTSVNGLLFVCNRFYNPLNLFVCNPITREYIRLPSPLEPSFRLAIHGFGVSKMSGEYKVVRMNVDATDCQMHTVGTGSWRKIEFDDQLWYYKRDAVGAFLNGNLHWLAYKGSSPLISCLDLETECFSTFSPPPPTTPPPCGYGDYECRILCDYLCVCDTFFRNQGWVRGIDIWLMKEYGDDKSWTKEFHIINTDYGYGSQFPIKVFNDGDILMQWGSTRLLYYSKKRGRETFREVDLFKGDDCTCASIYSPSFLPLKSTFAMENVISFDF